MSLIFIMKIIEIIKSKKRYNALKNKVHDENYFQKQLVLLRAAKDNRKMIVIPSEKIQSTEMIEAEYTKTAVERMDVNEMPIGDTDSKETCKRLQICIVSGEICSSTEVYFLNFYDPQGIAMPNISYPDHRAIQEYVRKFLDEINNTM